MIKTLAMLREQIKANFNFTLTLIIILNNLKQVGSAILLLTLTFLSFSALADQPSVMKYQSVANGFISANLADVCISDDKWVNAKYARDFPNLPQQIRTYKYHDATVRHFDQNRVHVVRCYGSILTWSKPSYWWVPTTTEDRKLGTPFAIPICPYGSSSVDFDTCSTIPAADPKSTPDSECTGDATKKSISFSAGNEVIQENDYTGYGVLFPTFTRTYNSTSVVHTSNFGPQWRNYLNHSIQAFATIAYAYRPGGKIYSFNQDVEMWSPDADINDSLVEVKDVNGERTGWAYTNDASSKVENYDAKGKLLSITNQSGLVLSLNYNTNGRGTSVTDALGRSLHFDYDVFNRITSMTNPAGGRYLYAYEAPDVGTSNLASITYPDNAVKTYYYGEVGLVSAAPQVGVSNASLLTGITDENNSRYATYRYDASGRAYDEELAPDLNLPAKIEHNNLFYNVDASGNPTTTVLTDPRGTNRTYNFTTILGVVKSTGTDQPAGAGCAASGSNLTYDVNGNIATRNDFNGNQTTYVYDMARNLETSRTEGLTTAGAATTETRTIATTWHPTWRLPLTISEYTGATATGTALKVTTYVYDTKGNITSFSIADPINNKTRTTTTAYTYSSAVPGLMLTKIIDGPRTDVSDITTYSYYPHDATCAASTATPIIDPITSVAPDNLGCRGQAQSITNALNQTTTYDRYNHHGQVEQMTDANGLVTTSTYDLRQRITNRTVGTEVTNFQYDNVGQLTQLTLPDNSTLAYTYDAAHRLADIQDNLGNKVHYTLDTQGNRISEDTTDPTNQLTKTLSRSYDALNRLEQLTGVE